MDNTAGFQATTAYRPPANFSQKLNLLNANPVLPQKVNLNNVDPAYRDYYAAYNDSLDTLSGTASNVKTQASLAQQDVQNAYGAATTGAENAYKSSITGIQSANQDAQLANRLRTRAMGGAPSSGFYDLANRTDIQSQRDVGAAGQQLGQAYQGADLSASQALTKIVSDLNNAILGIQSNGQLSLRQRDQQIAQAKASAAAAAQQAALLEGLSGNQEQGGDVLGASTTTGAPDPYAGLSIQVDTGSGLQLQPGSANANNIPLTYRPQQKNAGFAPQGTLPLTSGYGGGLNFLGGDTIKRNSLYTSGGLSPIGYPR